MKHSQIRIRYVRGAESFPFLIAQAFGVFSRYGIDVQLQEYVGEFAIDQLASDAKPEFVLKDSLSALAMRADGRLPDSAAGIVIRGGRNELVLSGEFAALANALATAKGAARKTMGQRGIRKPIRVGSAYRYGTTDLYCRAFEGLFSAGSTLRQCLPAEMFDRALSTGQIDAYCCGDVCLQAPSGVPMKMKSSPSRREMALVAPRGLPRQLRPLYARTVAAVLDAAKILAIPEEKTRCAAEIAIATGLPLAAVETSIADAYSPSRARDAHDAGVFSSSMRGGVVRPSPQWETVARSRSATLGVGQPTDHIGLFDSGLYDESVSQQGS